MQTTRKAYNRAAWLRALLTAAGLALLFWTAMDVAALAAATGSDMRAVSIAGVNDNGSDDSDGEVEWEGFVLSAPGGGVGTWVLQRTQVLSGTVIADARTRFDKGIPQVGAWVKAKGILQPDGSLAATRIRPDEYEAGEVVVRLATGVLSSTFASRYELTPLSAPLASADIYLFATGDDEESIVQTLLADPDVEWAELNFVSSAPEGNPYKTWRWGGPQDDGFVNQAAYQQVNLAPAQHDWSGRGVVVAVLDTGIDYNHPAFAGRMLPGRDVIGDDADPQEEGGGLAWGHGTHVAGIIAYMAPESDILPVRVLDSNGRGNTWLLAYAVEWAAGHGADVINMSLGTDFDSQVLHDVIERVEGQGVVLVAAAGNAATDEVQYPAAYDEVLAVTAVDSQGHKADFANYGTWVGIAAPGVGVTSTMVGPDGSGYASWSGTSMATSFASGAAALMREKSPDEPAAVVRQALIDSAFDLDPLNPLYLDQLGGLLDVGAALVEDSSGGGDGTMRVYLPLVAR